MRIHFSRTFLLCLGGALMLAGIILGLNVARPGADHGAIEKPCGELHWPSSRLPAVVLVDESAAEWAPALREASFAWSHVAGREVLRVEDAQPSAWTTFASALAGEGLEPAGHVLVVAGDALGMLASPATTGADDGDAIARLRWREDTCAIGYGVVRIALDGEPRSEAVMRAVALHELGHVLGLADDDLPRSVMADIESPKPGAPTFGRVITERDAAWVRARASPD